MDGASGLGAAGAVARDPDLMLRVDTAQNEDDEPATLVRQLRIEVLGLDVQVADLVFPAEGADLPVGAKGAQELAEWLAIHLGTESARRVVFRVADWASRNGRVVEVKIGDDVLKLGRATRDQQGKIIDAWLSAHSSRS
jgi:hypothetical protein